MIEQKQNSQPKDYSLENQTQIDIGVITLPEGILISQNSFGYCIIASKEFKINQEIDPKYKCLKVPINIQKVIMTINGVKYTCDKTHTIISDTFRYFPVYNSYLNHSCDPNTVFIQNIKKGIQSWRVLKQIKVGQEITCNYLNFCYDEDQSEYFMCKCGSVNCFKEIKGFKYLNFDDKIKLLPILCQQTKKSWLEDDKILLIQDIFDQYPVELRKANQKEYSLLSNANFNKNDIIFKFNPLKTKQDSIILVKHGDSYKKIELVTEFPDKKTSNDFEYLRALIKNSNTPNIKMQIKGQCCIGVCVDNIKVGQQFTVQWNAYENY